MSGWVGVLQGSWCQLALASGTVGISGKDVFAHVVRRFIKLEGNTSDPSGSSPSRRH